MNYTLLDKFPEDKEYKHKVAMYHGTVANSKVDSGLNLSHGLDWDKFAGFDLVLLGDIHKRQVLCKEDPYMFYPGSLVQQNFGESFEGHGYAIVDLTEPKKVKCDYFDIPNEYGYYTLDIVDGILPTNQPITSKTSVRLRTKNTSAADIKKILAEIRKKYKNSEVVVVNLDKSQIETDMNIGDSISEMGSNTPVMNLGSDYLVKYVAGGSNFKCALLSIYSSQYIKCWGYNYDGELGAGNTYNYGSHAGDMGDYLPTVQLAWVS